MSIRWRLLGAFILIIALAVSLSVGVGYYTTQAQLDAFTAGISRNEADKFADTMSQTYTSSDGWRTVDSALLQAGYLYSEGPEHQEGDEGEGGEERVGEGAEEGTEVFHIDRIRIVIVDIEGIVIRDNFAHLAEGEVAPTLDGQRTTIVDFRTNQPVGYAYVDVNREFLATESLGFLQRLLYSSVIGGLLIAAIALFLALWLSRRITAPVTALTQATKAIVQRDDTTLLPVISDDELGQMSAAFNQMTNALQKQRVLRKRLLDDVSHELNTPLSIIHLEAKGLSDGLQTPDEAAVQIIQEVNMLRNLVSDLNWLAETDSGELRLTLEPFSIHQLLINEVERWQPQARIHQITLTLLAPPELPTFSLDQMRMSQALGNIINNALQHTAVGGQIIVTATMEAVDVVGISVTDDGAGIDVVDLPHIFDRFYRAEQSRTRPSRNRERGTGLGLAIARSIVEAHSGTIVITSKGLGQGATVKLELPLHLHRE